jgi:hypothetical protein
LVRRVVKRSRVLIDAEGEAAVPYEETRLAKRAVRSRARLAGLLAAGAALLALEFVAALLQAHVAVFWLVAAPLLLAAGVGVRRGRLGAIVGAALLALVGVLLPFTVLALDAGGGWARVVGLVAPMLLAAACLPDVVLLLRDAELQHAYGRWARRGTAK